MRASSMSSTAGSVMLVRCGQSPFRWLKKLSMCAWSVGVPGRPWCWVIAVSAINCRRLVRRPLLVRGRHPLGIEQVLVLECGGEQQLRLRARLLGGEQVADPVAGDDVNDRVGDPLAPGEVRRVPYPDAVLLPRNLRHSRQNRARTERLARQH